MSYTNANLIIYWCKIHQTLPKNIVLLFYKRITTDLKLYFYISTLLFFKLFVLVFEQKEPMVYRPHDELKETLRSFSACFLKIEKVKSMSTKKCSK